jgi:predicted negative regulator of RcsB-dependent stress response
MFDEVERAVKSADAAKIDRVFGDIKDKFGSTTYAQQAGLLVAKQYYAAGKPDAAKTALSWVADKSSDPGYQAVARLRLAGLLLDSKAYDEALKQLSASFPPQFEALAADRKGDILLNQGKKKEALAEYGKAFKGFDERTEYRRLVEIKLNSLGVDPKSTDVLAPEGKK